MKILFIFGTRPEVIKTAPLLMEFQKYRLEVETKVCNTAQHRELINNLFDFFKIKPDYDLNLMRPDQSLFSITSFGLQGLEKVLNDYRPDLIFVQGDTTTAFIGSLACYYKQIKVAHLEAGLRSHNKYAPYPEEMNRILVGHLTDYHFTPTERAKQNLYNEGISENVFVVGNTVIDALFLTLDILRKNLKLTEQIQRFFNAKLKADIFNGKRKLILVTGHRRESFGGPFQNIFLAIKEIADRFDDVEFIYPVHMNPNVKKPVYEILNDHERIHLMDPIEYPYFIWLMKQSYLVLTDSGGVQEEAPSLGKPVLVMREVTERTEGIAAGTARLVGTDKNNIIEITSELIKDQYLYNLMAKASNPYGDGKASEYVVTKILEKFS